LGRSTHKGSNYENLKAKAMYISPSFIENEDTSTIPNEIKLKNGTIYFCSEFKYLGCTLTNNLKDKKEISARLETANIQFSSLCNVFNNQKVNLSSKILLYKSIILNAALWGCKSWALSADSKQKLECFQSSIIQKLLNINMYMIKNKHITHNQI
jgi:hypothetical protein